MQVYQSHGNGNAKSDWSYNLFEGFKVKKKISWDSEGTYQCVGRKNYLEEPNKYRSTVITHEFFLAVRGNIYIYVLN